MKPALTFAGIAALALGASLLVIRPLAAENLPVLSAGQPAPDFTAVDENGKEHRLADYRGQALVLEWTNQSCPYVQRHYDADTMKKLAQALGARSVTWLAVNSTRTNTPADTVAWRDRVGMSYATLQDADGAIGRAYGARTTPHMFVIDANGILQYSGAIDDDPRGRESEPVNYVRRSFEAIFAGAAPDPSATEPYGCSVKYAAE